MSIIAFLYRFWRSFKWICQAIHLRVLSKDDAEVNISRPEGSSFILIPHVDDEWIGCSQVVLSNTDVYLCDMDMPGGDCDEIHAERKKELDLMAEKFNHPVIAISNDKVYSLKKEIMEKRPRNIFVPFFIDWHSEHQEVINILHDSLSQLERQYLDSLYVIMYQVSVPMPYKAINCGLSMSIKSCYYKWNVFKQIYSTQTMIPRFRFACNEYINGGVVKKMMMEPYSKLKATEWLNHHLIFSPFFYEMGMLKDNVNNLNESRKAAMSFYIRVLKDVQK